MKTVTITRITDDGTETTGTLSCGEFNCDTLERPYKNNEHGISCIPMGEYTCKWGHMNAVNKDHYQVMGVRGRDAIFIHGGNFVTDSHGCILLGMGKADINKDGEQDITGSGVAIQAFEALMNKEDFKLIIQ